MFSTLLIYGRQQKLPWQEINWSWELTIILILSHGSFFCLTEAKVLSAWSFGAIYIFPYIIPTQLFWYHPNPTLTYKPFIYFVVFASLPPTLSTSWIDFESPPLFICHFGVRIVLVLSFFNVRDVFRIQSNIDNEFFAKIIKRHTMHALQIKLPLTMWNGILC